MKTQITANYPKHEVLAVLKFAAKVTGVKHSGVMVKVKNSKSISRGMAYHDPYTWKDYNNGVRRLITIGLGNAQRFPFNLRILRRDEVFNDWRECLVCIAAHEFYHIVQYDDKLTVTETQANWHGWFALQEWRKDMDNTG